MYVQEIILEKGSRYMLVDEEGIPILPVVKYIKYLDNTGKSRNTQKSYCYALKHYFSYLQESKKDYLYIRLDDLVEFVGWLRNPYQSTKIIPITSVKAQRAERTANLNITVVTNFYDYLYRNDELPTDIGEKLMRYVFTGGRRS